MFAVAIYFAAIVGANLLVATFGPWFSPINSFALIGLDLALRDYLHERWQGGRLFLRMFGLIAGAGLVSYLVNPASGQIAVASSVAFSVAGLINALAYHLSRRWPYLMRSNVSNAPAALADSMIFPAMAFGAFLPGVVAAQFAAKVGGGFMWSLVMSRRLDKET